MLDSSPSGNLPHPQRKRGMKLGIITHPLSKKRLRGANTPEQRSSATASADIEKKGGMPISAVTVEGDSGAPIFLLRNGRFELGGMVTFLVPRPRGLGFGIKINSIMAQINKYLTGNPRSPPSSAH
jgi:hypothetical protein